MQLAAKRSCKGSKARAKAKLAGTNAGALRHKGTARANHAHALAQKYGPALRTRST